MDPSTGGSETRFDGYVDALVGVLGHADRAGPLRDYCTGLLMPVGRKSVEPLAAVTAPARVSAKHQSLLHFVGQAPWSDAALLAKVRDLVLPVIERSGPIRAWIIDDTGLPKKGMHSVGVARQYCGQLGKQDNCQVAVTLSIANDTASLPIAHRLYLPEPWCHDTARRAKAGVPDDIVFRTKPEIALEQISAAQAAGVAPGVVLADAGYGTDTDFRDGISRLGLTYVMGVQGSISVWPPGQEPLPAKPWSGRGRRTSQLRRSKQHQPVSAKALALDLPSSAWQSVTWREGTNAPLSSRFAALRIRPAHRDQKLARPRPIEWLLIEWPADSDEPSKYWLSTAPDDIALAALVDLAKLRWRIERDYQDLKQEVGLGHYEGRGWRGFHHHAALCIAAYGFLVSERQTIPPSGPRKPGGCATPVIPAGHRSRAAPDPARAPRRNLDHNLATTADRGTCPQSHTVSLLRANFAARDASDRFMTQ
jgi:SRSO17 transposase